MRVQSLFDLSGKAALVVGGGAVPHAIAALFRDAGAAVTHAQEPALDEASVAALFASVPELDILVNGAIRPGAWTLETLAMDEWDRVHAVNLRGAFLLMREAVRTMRAHARGGRIVTISTIGAMHPVLHGNFAYGASRAGANALTRQFALDFAGEGILTNAILVGAIPSDPFPEGARSPEGPGVRPERFPLGQGRPEDVAPVALLLASEAGRYVNGQAIAVDGGFQVA